MTSKPVVSITIRGLDKMKRGERRRIFNYMTACAKWVLKHGDLAASTFRRRLYA